MSQSTELPFLLPDARVPILLGSGFVQQLTEVLAYLLADHQGEDIAAVLASTPLPPWAQSAATINQLLQEVLKVAIENNMVTYRSLEDVVADAVS